MQRKASGHWVESLIPFPSRLSPEPNNVFLLVSVAGGEGKGRQLERGRATERKGGEAAEDAVRNRRHRWASIGERGERAAWKAVCSLSLLSSPLAFC